MLFCSELEWTCTGVDIFTKLKEKGLSSEKTVLVCVGTGLERCWGKIKD